MLTAPLFAYNLYLVHLPVLIVVVSLVYSGTRYDHWGAILWEALRWGGRLTGFLICVVGFLSLLNEAFLLGIVEEVVAGAIWGVLLLFNKS
jgi:hypothetical protein